MIKKKTTFILALTSLVAIPTTVPATQLINDIKKNINKYIYKEEPLPKPPVWKDPAIWTTLTLLGGAVQYGFLRVAFKGKDHSTDKDILAAIFQKEIAVFLLLAAILASIFVAIEYAFFTKEQAKKKKSTGDHVKRGAGFFAFMCLGGLLIILLRGLVTRTNNPKFMQRAVLGKNSASVSNPNEENIYDLPQEIHDRIHNF